MSKTVGRRLTNALVNHRALPPPAPPNAGVSPVIAMKELPNLLRGLEMFFQTRGAGEPEGTRTKEAGQTFSGRSDNGTSHTLGWSSSWGVFSGPSKGLPPWVRLPAPFQPHCAALHFLALLSPLPMGWAGGGGVLWGRGEPRRLSISRHNSGLPTAQGAAPHCRGR